MEESKRLFPPVQKWKEEGRGGEKKTSVRKRRKEGKQVHCKRKEKEEKTGKVEDVDEILSRMS